MIDPDVFEDRQERTFLRTAILKTLAVLVLILAALTLIGVLLVHKVNASPIAEAGGEGVVVTLTDEPCVIPAVSNLKYRATWTEKGTIYEGCFALSPAGVVMLYFSDRSVVAMPVSIFQRVMGV